MKRRGCSLTPDLLSWTPPTVAVGYGEDVAGRGALENRIARTISRALKDAKDKGLSRGSIAQAMSDFLGRAVSEDMLNKWASEASEQHRITLDAFIALIDATGGHDLIGLVASSFGFVVVPEKYADLIEITLIEERENELAARKQAVAARWKAKR